MKLIKNLKIIAMKNKILESWDKIKSLYNQCVDGINKINIKLASVNARAKNVKSPQLLNRIKIANTEYKTRILPRFNVLKNGVEKIKSCVNDIKNCILKLMGLSKGGGVSGADEGIGIAPLVALGAAAVISGLTALLYAIKKYFSRLEKLDQEMIEAQPDPIQTQKEIMEYTENAIKENDEKILELNRLAAEATDPVARQNYLEQARLIEQQSHQLRLQAMTPVPSMMTPGAIATKQESITEKIKSMFGLKGLDLRWIAIAIIIVILIPVFLPLLKNIFTTITQTVKENK